MNNFSKEGLTICQLIDIYERLKYHYKDINPKREVRKALKKAISDVTTLVQHHEKPDEEFDDLFNYLEFLHKLEGLLSE